MTKSSQVKALHLAALSTEADGVFRTFGFRRSAKGNCYCKDNGSAKWEIDICLTMPRYSDDDSIAHIAPMVRIAFGDIEQLYDKAISLVPGSVPRVTTHAIVMPIGLVGPDGRHHEWRPKQESQYNEQISQVADFARRYALPYLEKYSNKECCVDRYLQGDKMLPPGDAWAVMAMCFAKNLNRTSDIDKIFDLRFGGKIGLMQHYGPARQYLLSAG